MYVCWFTRRATMRGMYGYYLRAWLLSSFKYFTGFLHKYIWGITVRRLIIDANSYGSAVRLTDVLAFGWSCGRKTNSLRVMRIVRLFFSFLIIIILYESLSSK